MANPNKLDISIFHYEPQDLLYTIESDGNTESKLDSILKKIWNDAEEQGVLRYKLNIKDWKILEGSYNFLAQLNLDRASNRRRPENITSMSQPFDATGFNFTKLPAREIVLDIGDGSGNDVIAVNVSPIEWRHFLFLPERFKCSTQKMKESCLIKALELILLSNSQFFRIAFNSLCAHASVNHLHWHLYYLKHKMLLENIELQRFEGPLFILRDYPAKGFCLKLSWFDNHDIRKLGYWAFFVINYLQENSIAHNVYITRAKTYSMSRLYDDIRIYIWARKPSRGVKDTHAFIPAVCECFGHLSIRSEEEYTNLSEEKVSKLLSDITDEVFGSLQERMKEMIKNEMKRK